VQTANRCTINPASADPDFQDGLDSPPEVILLQASLISCCYRLQLLFLNVLDPGDGIDNDSFGHAYSSGILLFVSALILIIFSLMLQGSQAAWAATPTTVLPAEPCQSYPLFFHRRRSFFHQSVSPGRHGIPEGRFRTPMQP